MLSDFIFTSANFLAVVMLVSASLGSVFFLIKMFVAIIVAIGEVTTETIREPRDKCKTS